MFLATRLVKGEYNVGARDMKWNEIIGYFTVTLSRSHLNRNPWDISLELKRRTQTVEKGTEGGQYLPAARLICETRSFINSRISPNIQIIRTDPIMIGRFLIQPR